MTLRLNTVKYQPFDFQFLKGLLPEYRYPRNKISKMLRSGDIIALKNGLYILSEIYQKPLVKEAVANLLYGPSYISLDYALSHYGLIPEIAYNISSVTTGRRKNYQTPLGTFYYHHLRNEYYCLGYRIESTEHVNYLIAIPEKALCDKLYLSPRLDHIKPLEQFLYEDLRLDPDNIKNLDPKLIAIFADTAHCQNLNLLKRLVT